MGYWDIFCYGDSKSSAMQLHGMHLMDLLNSVGHFRGVYSYPFISIHFMYIGVFCLGL
jgi:hypothetical protein